MGLALKLPFVPNTQRAILAAIEQFVGLPATDLIANTAPSYDDNPQAFMDRLVADLQYLRNQQEGTVVLVAGVGTVADTSVTATTVVFTQRAVAGGTVGVEYVFAASAGVGFTITSKAEDGSTETADTSTIAYRKFQPAATAATPTLTPGAGTYANDQTVAVASATSGVEFKYTLDGSTPSATVGSLAGPTIPISASATLKVVAFANGLITSGVASEAYNMVVATPTASPAAGTFANTQTITLATTTTGAQIRYTTDGSTPTDTTGTLYTTPFDLAISATVKAIAFKTGYTNSAVLSAAYVLTAATPVATPVAGSYVGAQVVTLATSTANASMRYTVDGSTPSDTVGTLYNGGTIAVAATLTLKAIAYKTGYTNSAVLSATYTIS
jgi:hypothetical protein